MNIITVNVGQGALAIVRHQKEAVIVDCRIPPSDDRTVAYVKEIMALSLKGHCVKGLILTGGKLHRNDVSVAHAVAASAAYPLFLPAFDETLTFEKDGTFKSSCVILTDGGVYDNLGLGCL